MTPRERVLIYAGFTILGIMLMGAMFVLVHTALTMD